MSEPLAPDPNYECLIIAIERGLEKTQALHKLTWLESITVSSAIAEEILKPGTAAALKALAVKLEEPQ